MQQTYLCTFLDKIYKINEIVGSIVLRYLLHVYDSYVTADRHSLVGTVILSWFKLYDSIIP